ncbi:hypothetical protein [Bacillus sp. J37]|uniref:hypothetical protein n=1 Tax=Bacillus sp. J37 TaxID=935837 RepID=UPI00047B0D33|nr:hypothetical protein [Bacillus sp. J37]
MQFYLVAIPVALLWFHSMYVLLEKHNGEEYWWLRTYLFLGMIYFIAIPTLAVKDITEFFGLSNGISATLMGITGIVLILVLINKTPKKQKGEFVDESNDY